MAKLNLQEQINSTRYRQANAEDGFEDFVISRPNQTLAGKIVMLPLGQLVEYQDEVFERLTGQPQPFRPYDREELVSLSKSIAEHGVLDPIIVKPIGIDRYQILAGRNRTRASAMCGKAEIPAIIRSDIDDIAAAMIMLDTNLEQRHNLRYYHGAHRILRQVHQTYSDKPTSFVLPPCNANQQAKYYCFGTGNCRR